MPTPSELQNERPRRSIFGNYRPSEPAPVNNQQPRVELEGSIDCALARTFLYRYLARVFEDPDVDGWQWLTSSDTREALRLAVNTLTERTLIDRAAELVLSDYDDFAASHIVCFGHTVRGDCPMNEIEYGDIKADLLFQPHRLSDLGAFFAAFGLELVSDAAERIDHISIQLEFMSVLAAKESHALERRDDEAFAMVRDAQKKFLREHLARWSPAFARRLARMAEGTPLGTAARLLGAFVKVECARLDISPGSEDLLLRPVDDSMERLCGSCGIHRLPPGAGTTGAKF